MFKGLWADVTEVAMISSSIIERFDVIKNIYLGQFSGFVDSFADVFFFKLLKNDSATALS